MRPSILNPYLLLLAFLTSASCSGLRHLPEGEKLYSGSEIELESTVNLSKKKTQFIKSNIKEAIRPNPNKTYLGMRPNLWLWELAGENPKTKFKIWLQSKGEPPVLLSSIRPEITAEIIDAKIFNIGIFRSTTSFSIIEKKHSASVTYTSQVHQQYRLSEPVISISDDNINRLILLSREKSLIKANQEYNLTNLKNERIRIDASLKEHGYFYFSPDFLIFKADTSSGDHTVKLTLMLKDSTPASALAVYRINRVLINQNYSLDNGTKNDSLDVLKSKINAMARKESVMDLKQAVILRSVFLKKDEVYTRKNHNTTLNHLMSLGIFKFIQIRFSESDTTAPGYLDVSILMTPMTKRTFSAELEIVSKSNNYSGPRMNISFLNRNTFRGAEMLNINMAGSFEIQLSGKDKNSYSYSFNPQAELKVPFFLVPFRIKSTSLYVPQTRFTLSYNYLKRVDYFDMQSLQFIYGYKWKRDIRQDHELNPIKISYTALGNQTDLFTSLLDSNPYLRRSYEERLIAGGSYSFTYNEQVIPGKTMQFFIHLTSETGGNALALTGLLAGKTISSDHPSVIAGTIYSQYVRFSADGRVYYNLSGKAKLAARLFAGLARPYGNSSILPYTKQFFSGGPNSIRAFHINSLGPGNFQQTSDNQGFLQLGGDLKLEMNTEYRFTIFRFLKGAIFVDAGNIWLLKSTGAKVEDSVPSVGFSNDFAVGAGLGLRIDVSFFILRFDLATPLRKPWLGQDQSWVINQINFGDKTWRRDNLILNVAIGYPF